MVQVRIYFCYLFLSATLTVSSFRLGCLTNRKCRSWLAVLTCLLTLMISGNIQIMGLYDNNHETAVMFWNVSRLFLQTRYVFSCTDWCSYLCRSWTCLTQNNIGHCWDLSRAAVDLRCCTCCVIFFGFPHVLMYFSVRYLVDPRSLCPTSSSAMLARTSTACLRQVCVWICSRLVERLMIFGCCWIVAAICDRKGAEAKVTSGN